MCNQPTNQEILDEIEQLREEITGVVSNIENVVDRFDTLETKMSELDDRLDQFTQDISKIALNSDSVYATNLEISKRSDDLNTNVFLLDGNVKELINVVLSLKE